jgi:hypothetical protein
MQPQSQITDTLSNYDFVVMAPNDWLGQWMNRQQLFSRIGQHTNVVYSQGLPYSWDLKSFRDLLKRPFRQQKIDNFVTLDLHSSLLVRWPKSQLLEKALLKIHGRQLEKLASRQKKRVLYIFHPHFYDYVDVVEHDLLIYHPYDDFIKQGAQSSSLSKNESSLVNRADIVITPSMGVTENLSKRYGRSDIKTVHNGVDFAGFSNTRNVHKDVQAIDSPRVGYIGSINIKVDIDLLLDLSNSFPQVNLLLVGPVGVLGVKEELFKKLSEQKNVHLLGSRHYSELPSIAAGMDCHLMCYDTSPTLWAKFAYPLKLNEYLATKKPVISCPLPSVENLNQFVDVVTSPDECKKALEKILLGKYDKSARGFEYASHQDWLSRVAEIAELIRLVRQM